jgi:hypothetical protein
LSISISEGVRNEAQSFPTPGLVASKRGSAEPCLKI